MEQFLHERYIRYKCKCGCTQHCGMSCRTEDCDCTECRCPECETNENIQKSSN